MKAQPGGKDVMQTGDDGMREIAQVDKKRVSVSSATNILVSTAALIAAMAEHRAHPVVKFRRDRCGNTLISGKNRKNSARADGRRSVMRMKLAAKREKAKRRRWQERMATGGVR